MLDDGSVFVAQPIANQVARVTNDGVVPVAGNLNSSAVAGVTSVTFGRTWRDLGTIYVSTTGAITNPVNGTFTEGGKVVGYRGRLKEAQGRLLSPAVPARSAPSLALQEFASDGFKNNSQSG